MKAVGDSWNASLTLLSRAAVVAVRVLVFFWWLVFLVPFGLVWWRFRWLATKKPETEVQK